jgi:hypothetical protein
VNKPSPKGSKTSGWLIAGVLALVLWVWVHSGDSGDGSSGPAPAWGPAVTGTSGPGAVPAAAVSR